MSNKSTANLWDRFTTRTRQRSSLYCWTGTRFEGAPWDEVVRDAEQMTSGLRRAGVVPGARVATVLGNSPETARGLLATWLAGGTVASLPMPARGMAHAEYVGQISTICAQLDPALIVIDEGLRSMFSDELPTSGWHRFMGTGAVAATPPGDDDQAFIQFSSGSVGSPKGCVLTPRAINAQLDIIAEYLQPAPGDRWVGWLPLSHDMGLFAGLLNCLGNDIDQYLSTPMRFAFSPATWLGDAAATGATMTIGSSSALHLAARVSSRRVSRWSDTGLSNLRVCVVGAERVVEDTLSLVVETFAPAGLRDQVLKPAYGLAEATLAVTLTPMSEQARAITVDGFALSDCQVLEVDAEYPGATTLVSSGPACTGVSLTGTPTTSVGEILVRSPCLAGGYWRDDARTAEVFRDGTLVTGDLGFIRDGYLFPVGRSDDMISIAGRKVYAREIENSVETIPTLRRGCSTLIGEQEGGKHRLTLLVETRHSDVDFAAVAAEVASRSMAKAAVVIDECVFLERDSLPKTPSGKIQRYRCRALLRAGAFQPLATVRLDSGR